MDEAQIITAVCNGDIDRYAELVERYQIGLIIYCDRLLGDRLEAEDTAQKAFIKAYDKLPTFDSSKARFSTWLYKIAANEAIDFLRKSKRTRPTEDIEELAPDTPDVLEQELIREVRDAVLALVPPEHRRAVEAYYWEGKSYQAIADDMQVPINTVKSWLRRAKAQLREALS
ncbi:MAG: sigma-70 family RNA polymerase sigma factor [Candidatus Saccharimonadales bacterium]